VFFNQGSVELHQWYPRVPLDRHLQPLDLFTRLLVGPKCICGRGSAPNSAGTAYSAPPEPFAGGELLPPLSALASNFSPSGLSSPPPKRWVPWAIKNAAKGSTSQKRLKSTALQNQNLISIMLVVLVKLVKWSLRLYIGWKALPCRIKTWFQ